MTDSQQTYTYRAGKKVALEKRPDQFVVRALPEELRNRGITDAEQVSSDLSRVTVRAMDLDLMMSRARHIAPTYHAYTLADAGEEFLITDRVFLAFREPPLVDVFVGKANVGWIRAIARNPPNRQAPLVSLNLGHVMSRHPLPTFMVGFAPLHPPYIY